MDQDVSEEHSTLAMTRGDWEAEGQDDLGTLGLKGESNFSEPLFKRRTKGVSYLPCSRPFGIRAGAMAYAVPCSLAVKDLGAVTRARFMRGCCQS